jgi:hypothetical protein
MKRLKIIQLRRGLHPSEVIIAVELAEGPREELIVDKRSIYKDSVRIGYPIAENDKNHLLVELPRETFRGTKRVWVPEKSVVPDEAAA